MCMNWVLSLHVYEHVLLIWMRLPVTHMWQDSIPTRDMTHAYVWHDAFISLTRFIQVRDMPRLYVRHDSLYVWHDSFICVTWLIHMRDMTHSYKWHDLFMCDITHSYEWYDSFICVSSLIHMCDMTHSYELYDSFIWVLSLIHMSNTIDSLSWNKCVYTPLIHIWNDFFTHEIISRVNTSCHT